MGRLVVEPVEERWAEVLDVERRVSRLRAQRGGSVSLDVLGEGE